ncbi:NUDIX domain-containing protein [Marinobacteraceae bacterium S3BR75-40.1]
MNEEEFLANYDRRAFLAPLVTVDSVLWTFDEGELKVLLVKRSAHPEHGKWGLPGGFVDEAEDQSIEDTALRKIAEKTGVKPPYIEQLRTVGNAHRDPRGWSVTVCYTALIARQDCEKQVESVDDVQWISEKAIESLELAFDHRAIIESARERFRQKALYSVVPAFALPETFTLPQLQRIHEVLIGRSVDKKSFRRRLDQSDLLVDTGEDGRVPGQRKARLYRLKPESKRYFFVRNLEE